MSQMRNGFIQRWDFCAGVLPFGINPTDVDLLFECHGGRFLVLEGKQPGEQMPEGQRRALDQLASLPQFTVIEFIGTKPDNIQRYRCWNDEWRNTTTDEFNSVIKAWYEWAKPVAA